MPKGSELLDTTKQGQFCQAARDISTDRTIETASILSVVGGGMLGSIGFTVGMAAETGIVSAIGFGAAVTGLGAMVVLPVAAIAYDIYRTQKNSKEVPQPPAGKSCVQYFIDAVNDAVYKDDGGHTVIHSSVARAVKKYPDVFKAVSIGSVEGKVDEAPIKFGQKSSGQMGFFMAPTPALELAR